MSNEELLSYEYYALKKPAPVWMRMIVLGSLIATIGAIILSIAGVIRLIHLLPMISAVVVCFIVAAVWGGQQNRRADSSYFEYLKTLTPEQITRIVTHPKASKKTRNKAELYLDQYRPGWHIMNDSDASNGNISGH